MNGEIGFKQLLRMYLTQPLFGAGFKTLNPLRFWYLHSVSHLESCWIKSQLLELDRDKWKTEFLGGHSAQNHLPVKHTQTFESVQFLERCWQQDFDN